MFRLAIWDPTDPKPLPLLQELAGTRDLAFTFTVDPDVAMAAVEAGRHRAAIVRLRAPPTVAESDTVAFLAARVPTVAILAVPSVAAVQALAELGVKEIFAEPIPARRVVQTAAARLHGHAGAPPPPCPMHRVEPVSCRIRVLATGEIVSARWLAASPAGFELEVDADLPPDLLVEVDVAPLGVRGVHGLIGRSVKVDGHGPWIVRFEAAPACSRPALQLGSGEAAWASTTMPLAAPSSGKTTQPPASRATDLHGRSTQPAAPRQPGPRGGPGQAPAARDRASGSLHPTAPFPRSGSLAGSQPGSPARDWTFSGASPRPASRAGSAAAVAERPAPPGPSPHRLGPRVVVEPVTVVALACLLTLAAGLAWMASVREEPLPIEPASTREVLRGIQQNFE